MKEKFSDAQLVDKYVKTGDRKVCNALISRHYDHIYRRFFRALRNTTHAEDCCQETWLKVFNSLDKYEEKGKFTHYLSVVARNVLMDFISKHRPDDEAIVDGFAIDNIEDARSGPDRYVDNAAELQYVVGSVIPSLPVKQRLAWLIYEESMFWEASLPLTWTALATLNGMDVDTVRKKFESARDLLLKMGNAGQSQKSGPHLDEEELLIFLVWTQANRAEKSQKHTWEYFADLLDVPASTLKTRHGAAQEHINRAIATFRESK